MEDTILPFKIKPAAQYGIAAFLSLFCFILITRAWHFQFTIPLFYSWDSLFGNFLIKSIVDTGWFQHNGFLGAPQELNLLDFPLNGDNLQFFFIKMMSLFTSNYALLFNSFYVLTFPVVTLSALWVLKRLGLGFPFALMASLLFAFTPFHFFRGQAGHMMLSSYYSIPLIVSLVLWVVDEEKNNRSRITLYSLIAIVVGSSGVYYAMFGSFFIGLAGLMIGVQRKQLLPFLKAVAVIALIGATLAVNMLNVMNYRAHYGINKEVPARAAFEAELYGLKIAPLLLPIDHDRVKPLARVKDRYNQTAMLVNTENNFATLGLVGGIGFLFLLAVVLIGLKVNSEMLLISRLNLSAILLATVGGFGSLLAYSLSPLIRCYSRISIFIAFFSLYAVFFLLQKMVQQSLAGRSLLSGAILLSVFGIGLYSQTNPSFSHLQQASVIENFKTDADFVSQIEIQMNNKGVIFQLPYVAFPESQPVFAMQDYEHLRPYLHSHSLKWSYGALKGRPLADWQKNVSSLSLPQMLIALKQAGFDGIYINRNGYQDHAQKLETELMTLLRKQPLLSKDQQLSFFDLRTFAVNPSRSVDHPVPQVAAA